jgi:hypothetical protein
MCHIQTYSCKFEIKFDLRYRTTLSEHWIFITLNTLIKQWITTASVIAGLLCTLLLPAPSARAAETDQFMTLELELKDSADALNRYLNEQAVLFLDIQNDKRHPPKTTEKLTQKYYKYLFRGLHRSRIRSWMTHSDELERFPDLSVSYREYVRQSAFSMCVPPFILPMGRTYRVGDVYFGIDKIGHFLGFGRRGFRQYQMLIKKGYSDKQAEELVILHGFIMERFLVGNVTDGIFSYADLEANYQGVMMAIELARTDNSYFKIIDGNWALVRTIDIQPFITPGFDETYNPNHYMSPRKKQVFKEIRERYCDALKSPTALERFSRYDTYPKSFCETVVDRYYATRSKDPRKLQSLENICAPQPE